MLAVITLGIYLVCWWYFINRELADLGRAKGTRARGQPREVHARALPGRALIVPALWTTVTTFKRVQAAQKLTGQTAINGWLGLRALPRDLAGDVRVHAERAERRLEVQAGEPAA